MSNVEIVTFGCRLNAFESDVMRGAAAQAGLADAIIVNTCAVTAEAERQARQAIRRAHREHPGRRIIVTGCAATLAPERYAGMPEVDLVLDNASKLKPESYGSDTRPRPRPHPLAAEEGVSVPRTRAYVQVQQGCDHRCTFCIIPFARGPSRSLPVDAIVAQSRTLLEAGVREIVLTGVDLTAYGADLCGQASLGAIARQLLRELPELQRLRLSSLDPSEIDDDLWALLADEPRLMPHLHLSLQAGDDLILKRMKRRHSRDEAIAVARRAREVRPQIAIGADLIAGFPTETEEMFRRSLDIVAECGLTFVHVFAYSPRPGTPASRMPQVGPDEVRDRAARLRHAAAEALAADLTGRVGREDDVLIERAGRGRASFYADVACEAPVPVGSIARLRFVESNARQLVGVAAQ